MASGESKLARPRPGEAGRGEMEAEHQVQVSLHPEVSATIDLEVVPEA